MQLDSIRQDITAGLRVLWKAPAVSVTTILLVALVIGGNTTVYSLVHSLMTKPASGIAADGLVTVQHLANGSPAGPAISYPDFEELASRTRTFRAVLASRFEAFSVRLPDGIYALRGVSVTANYFSELGVRLVRGRAFSEAEARLEGTGLRAVISFRLWQDHFAGAENVVGQDIVINRQPATIVGVAPADFHGLLLGEVSDVWVPTLAFSRAQSAEGDLRNRDRRSMLAIGRLAEGTSIAQARTELAAISAQLATAYPESNRDHAMAAVPYSLTAGGDSLFATRAPQFLAVFSLVTVLTLAVVCANVGNLMLARIVTRRRELAVRLSLGATRFRLTRLLVAEGIVLSLISWVLACGLAWGLSRLLLAFVAAGPATALTLVDITPDWVVLAYAMVLALGATVAFSLAPAVQVWRQDLLTSLKPGEAGTTHVRSRVSRGLAIVQLAFCVLLLVVAGLGYRSLTLIGQSTLGFDPSQLLLIRVNGSSAGQVPGERAPLISGLTSELGSMRGVVAVASARTAPPQIGISEAVRSSASGRPTLAQQNQVGPGFFSVLGLAPVSGREFVREDAERLPGVAILNQSLASTLWPGQSAIGRTLVVGERNRPVEIVGIVPDARYLGFQGDERPAYLFTPQAEPARGGGLATFYVRYEGPVDRVGPDIRASLARLRPDTPIVSMTTMDAAIADATSPIRIITLLLTIFAAGSLAVATIGLYGVISFTMRRRTREFGVRMALGASSQQVRRSVLIEGARLAGVGVAAGFVLSAIIASAARRLLFGITPTDVPTYASVFALMTLVALAAAYVPARRASRVVPSVALREE